MDIAHLIAGLRGEPMPPRLKIQPGTQPIAQGHVLPRAVARWQAEAPQREAAQREAEALRLATMPRAWIDGAEWQANASPEATEPPTARDQAIADSDTAPAPAEGPEGPQSESE